MTERYAKEGLICNPVPYQQCQNGHTYVELAPLSEPDGYTYVELAATAEPDGYTYVELEATAEPNGYIYTECNGTATVGTAYIPNPPPFMRYNGTCYQYTGTSDSPQGITIGNGYLTRLSTVETTRIAITPNGTGCWSRKPILMDANDIDGAHTKKRQRWVKTQFGIGMGLRFIQAPTLNM